MCDPGGWSRTSGSTTVCCLKLSKGPTYPFQLWAPMGISGFSKVIMLWNNKTVNKAIQRQLVQDNEKQSETTIPRKNHWLGEHNRKYQNYANIKPYHQDNWQILSVSSNATAAAAVGWSAPVSAAKSVLIHVHTHTTSVCGLKLLMYEALSCTSEPMSRRKVY